MTKRGYIRVSAESEDDSSSDIELYQRRNVTNIRLLSKNNNGYDNTFVDLADETNIWNCQCISRLFVLFVLLMVSLGMTIHSLPKYYNGSPSHPHEEQHHHHVYKTAAVAASQHGCSMVGVTILKEGGNAVDAAIASLLCQGVIDPHTSGIGGGFFMTIFNKTTNETTTIDAREVAPSKSTPDMFINEGEGSAEGKGLNMNGVKFIGVPGELKGYSYAYLKYGGGVSWERLFVEAIDQAQYGFAVSHELSFQLQLHKTKIVRSSLCQIFCDDTKQDVKKYGDIIHRTKLADTLTEVSKTGVDVFYKGKMAENMAKDIRENGGILSESDFTDYKVIERDTFKVHLPFAKATLLVPSLPSGGPILGLILSIMDGYNITSEAFEQKAVVNWHRTVEAFKHSYGASFRFGDHVEQQFVDSLLTPQNLDEIRQKIVDTETFELDHYMLGSIPDADRTRKSSTTHVSVLAPSGDSVSVTASINSLFGSFFYSNSSGVIFNDQIRDFDVNDVDSPNSIAPGKRPQSSMSPSIVLDDGTLNAKFIIGAAGGLHIPTSTALSLLRLLYFGAEDFDDAIEANRIHHQLLPDVLCHEPDFSPEILGELQKIGHEIADKPMEIYTSKVNGIKNHVSHIHAYSDTRELDAEADGW